MNFVLRHINLLLLLCIAYIVLYELHLFYQDQKGHLVDLGDSKTTQTPDSTVVREHYYLLVLILSNSAKTRQVSRDNWNNEAYFRSRNVSLKILYVVGRDQTDNHVETDIIKTNVSESKPNLGLKVREGLKVAMERYSFEYLLKTDTDVFHNYTRWEERIKGTVRENGEPLLYGGCTCARHLYVQYGWCAGMGYILHHAIVEKVVNYPLDQMENAEDRNTGKVMWEWGVKWGLSGGGRLKVTRADCKEGMLSEVVAVHVGYSFRNVEIMKHCWDQIGVGYG